MEKKKHYKNRESVQLFLKILKQYRGYLATKLRERGIDEATIKNVTIWVANARRFGTMPSFKVLENLKFAFTDEQYQAFVKEKEWQLKDALTPSVILVRKIKVKPKPVPKVNEREVLTLDNGEQVKVIAGCEKYKNIAVVERKGGERRVLDLRSNKLV